VKRRIVTIGSRGGNQIPRVCRGVPHFAIVSREHALAHMYMRRDHQVRYKGAMSMLHRFRGRSLDYRGKEIGGSVQWKCMQC
jgi:hypothetical protein